MKDLFFFRYSQEVPKSSLSGTLDGPNLAYIAVPQLDPATSAGNISIVDMSYSFPENTTLFANNIVQFNNNIGVNDTSNILLTNQYSNTNDPVRLTPINKTIPVRPLWYQYVFLPDFPLDPSPNGTYSIQIIDNNGNYVDSSHWVIYPSNTAPIGIYTDIVNTLAVWYQVIYMSNGVQVTKLLSSEPTFVQVTAFSSTNSNEYIAQYNAVLNIYYIYTNGQPTQTYSMLTIGTTKINVQHPIEAANTSPWYSQITNGYFKRFIGSNTYEYGIPEYFTQPFTPSIPYQYQINETPIFMNNSLLRLRQVPLARPNVLLNDVVIYILGSSERSDVANNDIQTAGNTIDLTPFENPGTISSIWYRLSIEDIDRVTGLVRINGVLAPDGTPVSLLPNDNVVYQSDTLVAFYYYQELDLIFNKISLNPILNSQLLTNGVSIYVTPSQATVNGRLYTATAVSNYLLFDQNENIIGSSDPLAPLGMSIDQFYTTTDGTGIPLIGNDRTTFLELARIFVRNVAGIRDITNSNLVDTRIPGGQLLDALPQNVIDIINDNTNDMYYLKDWGGVVLPGNSVVVVKLPVYLLNDNYLPTGTMLADPALTARMLDIRRSCKKHIAAGVLPLIRFYDQYGNIRYDLDPPLDRIYF